MDERTLELYNELVKIITPDTVFACVGAVRTTSYLDSVGPQVGDILQANGIPYVYGTHNKPYNGITAEKMAKTIKKHHKNNTVIAIDTCCCHSLKKLYKIQLEKGYISPGAGVGKELTKVGDYAIKAYLISWKDTELIPNSELLNSKKCGFLINKTDETVKIISDAIVQAYKDACSKPLIDIIEIENNKINVSKLI